MRHSMTRSAFSSRRRGLLACLWTLLATSVSGAATVCDDNSRQFNWNAPREQTWGQCVADGQSLKGAISSDELRLAIDGSDNPIVIEPRSGTFELRQLARRCVSRAVFDVVCAKAGQFLNRADGECALPGIYIPPPESELVSAALVKLFGASRDTCSPFALRALANPITIGPGSIQRLDAGSDRRISLLFQSIKLRDLTLAGPTNLTSLVVEGDLTIEGLQAPYLGVENVFVLGNMTVKGVRANMISFKRVWVLGSFRFADNVLDDYPVVDALKFRQASGSQGGNRYMSMSDTAKYAIKKFESLF